MGLLMCLSKMSHPCPGTSQYWYWFSNKLPQSSLPKSTCIYWVIVTWTRHLCEMSSFLCLVFTRSILRFQLGWAPLQTLGRGPLPSLFRRAECCYGSCGTEIPVSLLAVCWRSLAFLLMWPPLSSKPARAH